MVVVFLGWGGAAGEVGMVVGSGGGGCGGGSFMVVGRRGARVVVVVEGAVWAVVGRWSGGER
ncbi:hypothetical protein RHGRI_029668 [Rhododendron griersonianum]|nr:hypothetical protein RHGRI_029668 [Rhododendron griersonianum]